VFLSANQRKHEQTGGMWKIVPASECSGWKSDEDGQGRKMGGTTDWRTRKKERERVRWQRRERERERKGGEKDEGERGEREREREIGGRISSGDSLARLRGSVNECAGVDLGKSEPPLDDVYPSPYIRRIIATAC